MSSTSIFDRICNAVKKEVIGDKIISNYWPEKIPNIINKLMEIKDSKIFNDNDINNYELIYMLESDEDFQVITVKNNDETLRYSVVFYTGYFGDNEDEFYFDVRINNNRINTKGDWNKIKKCVLGYT